MHQYWCLKSVSCHSSSTKWYVECTTLERTFSALFFVFFSLTLHVLHMILKLIFYGLKCLLMYRSTSLTWKGKWVIVLYDKFFTALLIYFLTDYASNLMHQYRFRKSVSCHSSSLQKKTREMHHASLFSLSLSLFFVSIASLAYDVKVDILWP